MKKVLLIFTAIVFMASFAACSKKCVCVVYKNGVIINTEKEKQSENEFNLKDSGFRKCSEMNNVEELEFFGKNGRDECK